jgi:hypothetical protein
MQLSPGRVMPADLPSQAAMSASPPNPLLNIDLAERVARPIVSAPRHPPPNRISEMESTSQTGRDTFLQYAASPAADAKRCSEKSKSSFERIVAKVSMNSPESVVLHQYYGICLDRFCLCLAGRNMFEPGKQRIEALSEKYCIG